MSLLLSAIASHPVFARATAGQPSPAPPGPRPRKLRAPRASARRKSNHAGGSRGSRGPATTSTMSRRRVGTESDTVPGQPMASVLTPYGIDGASTGRQPAPGIRLPWDPGRARRPPGPSAERARSRVREAGQDRGWPEADAARPRSARSTRAEKIGARDHCSSRRSARRRSASGIVRPSVFAVLRLMTSSKLVGRSIGRLAGLAPLRIRSTKSAARL